MTVYVIIFMLSTLSSREEVDIMQQLFDFFISVMTGVVLYYIRKWLDRKDKKDS